MDLLPTKGLPRLALYSHLLQEHSIRVRKDTVTSANVGARVKEVDSKVRVVSFHTLGNVLDHGDVEGHRQTIDRQDHSLVFSV